jgi:hypothetical protein
VFTLFQKVAEWLAELSKRDKRADVQDPDDVIKYDFVACIYLPVASVL